MINWSHQEEGFCEGTFESSFSMMKMNMAMSWVSALKVLI